MSDRIFISREIADCDQAPAHVRHHACVLLGLAHGAGSGRSDEDEKLALEYFVRAADFAITMRDEEGCDAVRSLRLADAVSCAMKPGDAMGVYSKIIEANPTNEALCMICFQSIGTIRDGVKKSDPNRAVELEEQFQNWRKQAREKFQQ